MKNIIKKLPLLYLPLVAVKRLVTVFPRWLIFKVAKNWVILNSIHPQLRPWLWKLTGVKISGKIQIGYDVYYDVGHASQIVIEDGVWITSRSLLLCHKRDLTDYHIGDDYNELPYHIRPVTLRRGSVVGMGSIILPGVTVGEGAIVGAGSVVTRDVPPWTIVTGNPAVVVKELKPRDEQSSECRFGHIKDPR